MTNTQNQFLREIYESQLDRLTDDEIDQMAEMAREREEAEQEMELVEWRGQLRPEPID